MPPVIFPSVPQVCALMHVLHLHPTIFITAATPTSTYTTTSNIAHEPRSMLTTFQESGLPKSIPSPTKPQFKPPTINKILPIIIGEQRLLPQPQPIELHIYFLIIINNNRSIALFF